MRLTTFILVASVSLFAQQLPDPKTIFASSADLAKKSRTYQYESEMTIEMKMGSKPMTMTFTTTSVAGINPDRMRIDSKSQMGATTIVSDGQYTWTYVAALKQYSKKAALRGPDSLLESLGLRNTAARSGPGFPTTPNAYQRDSAGGIDAILARLDPQGSRLTFATYIGTSITDQILRMALAPDGSIWASLHSFVECCSDITSNLIHIDSRGERLLLEKPMTVEELAVDSRGNLIARVDDSLSVSSDAFLANRCAYAGLVKLTPQGEQVFATYLPAEIDSSVSIDNDGNPVVHGSSGDWKVVLAGSMGVFTGCVSNAASFRSDRGLSPGEIMTIFGSRMGPQSGAAFQLENGRLPTLLS